MKITNSLTTFNRNCQLHLYKDQNRFIISSSLLFSTKRARVRTLQSNWKLLYRFRKRENNRNAFITYAMRDKWFLFLEFTVRSAQNWILTFSPFLCRKATLTFRAQNIQSCPLQTWFVSCRNDLRKASKCQRTWNESKKKQTKKIWVKKQINQLSYAHWSEDQLKSEKKNYWPHVIEIGNWMGRF